MNSGLKSYILYFSICAYSNICPRQTGFANIVQCGIPTKNNSLHLRRVNLPSAPGRRGRGMLHNLYIVKLKKKQFVNRISDNSNVGICYPY